MLGIFSPSLMFLQAGLFIQTPLVVWKVQASAAPQIPAVHKHINTARPYNAAVLIDRNPKFLQWKCLCSPSAATQWARLSGVGWRHCERRPSLIPHIAQRRSWPWKEAIKIVPHWTLTCTVTLVHKNILLYAAKHVSVMCSRLKQQRECWKTKCTKRTWGKYFLPSSFT